MSTAAAVDGGLTIETVIPAALAAGALRAADVVDLGVEVEPVGRSHQVYRVSIGGTPAFFVKHFGPRRGATDGLASRERAVLELARSRPAVAALVAGPWPWEGAEPHGCVATAAVAGAEAWTLDVVGGGSRSIDEAWDALVDALVPPLAAFHRATRDLARPGAAVPDGLEPVEPWSLCLMDGDAAPELWATPATAALLREAAADPVLVAGLRSARALWRPLALVHADLKHDNVLAAPGPDGLAVTVLDWEMARIGDPAWDLAALTARLVVARGEGPPWPAEDVRAAGRLVARYAEATGLGAGGLAHRLVHYAAAVLLAMALQHGSTIPAGADRASARALVLRSRATFAQLDRLTRDVLAAAEAVRP